MPDLTAGGLSNSLADASGFGTAAMEVVDATKAFWGGPIFGFGHIKSALTPFLSPLGGCSPAFGSADILHTLKANWLNGVAKADRGAHEQ
jgi:hypothetical protein